MKSVVLAAMVVAGAAVWNTAQPQVPIVVDGDFGDWAKVPVAARDAGDATTSPVDFGDVRAAADGRYLFVNVEIGRSVNIPTLPGTLFFIVDLDGDAATGRQIHRLDGADLVVEFSPAPASPTALPTTGVVIRRQPPPATGPATATWSAAGLVYAPRHASRQFEWRIDRGPSTRARIKLVYASAGAVLDELDPIDVSMPPLVTTPALTRGTGDVDPLVRGAGAEFRVAVWNVLGMTPFSAEATARIIAALDPDILVLDEVWRALTPSMIQTRLPLESRASRLPWAVVSTGGQFERSAVAVRGEVELIVPSIAYPQEGMQALVGNDAADRIRFADAGVGGSVALAHLGARRVLVVPVDMTSGGPPESHQESRRVLEADAINRAVQVARGRVRADAILVGGDLNLVGTHYPREIIAQALDLDRSPLDVVDAMRLNDISKDTWRAIGGGGRFPPGRLDWLLHSGSSLDVVRSFVLDAADLSPRWLAHHKLTAGDSNVSDHLPIVADFRWRR